MASLPLAPPSTAVAVQLGSHSSKSNSSLVPPSPKVKAVSLLVHHNPRFRIRAAESNVAAVNNPKIGTVTPTDNLMLFWLCVDPFGVSVAGRADYGVVGVHHVGILCENLEKSLEFYEGMLGLEINEARPHDKLPYRGAWLWVGAEMIHLMELPNPDPLTGRPEHGGRDRHACLAIRNVSNLKSIFDQAGHPYTLSKSGRPAIFTRDPDANALEFTQVD
ncbi:Glyoxylase I 4 [Linum grandiflorum]